MKIKLKYAKQEDIPKGFEELYEEKDGAWALVGVEGMKTDADVAKVQDTLTKVRKERDDAQKALKAFGDDVDPEKIAADLDELSELRRLKEAGSLKGADEQVKAQIDAAVLRAISPLEREKAKLQRELDKAKSEATESSAKVRNMTVRQAVASAAAELKMVPTAVEDAVTLASAVFELGEDGKVTVKDNAGFTPGATVSEWLTDIREKRPHWWPPTEGAGSSGGSGGSNFANNPFTAEHWNMTEQGRMLRADPSKAERAAKAAGTTIGGPKPKARSAA